jgi:ABC-type antimicrobial peptide transport system permease subunit
VYERTREIGIIKSTAASPGDVRRIFVVEAALIGFTGGVIGGRLLGQTVSQPLERVIPTVPEPSARLRHRRAATRST